MPWRWCMMMGNWQHAESAVKAQFLWNLCFGYIYSGFAYLQSFLRSPAVGKEKKRLRPYSRRWHGRSGPTASWRSSPGLLSRYALDYRPWHEPFTGKTLPVWLKDVRKWNTALLTLLAGMAACWFGVGRLFTRKSWLDEHTEPATGK